MFVVYVGRDDEYPATVVSQPLKLLPIQDFLLDCDLFANFEIRLDGEVVFQFNPTHVLLRDRLHVIFAFGLNQGV